MSTVNKSKKTHIKLGFSHIETVEIVTYMNELLADYHVHYQKLRNFHWNVEGPDFFELHENFENQYNNAKVNIDEIAERIRVFGKRPLSTMQEYLNSARIKESTKEYAPYEMVQEILVDYEILLSDMVNITNSANDNGDAGTIDMITSFIKKLEKNHWMLTSWLKNPTEKSSTRTNHP
ncbi:MAG: starvation-inducible DNA-binding protein [Cyclobacteriaceae bacterium]|jgi:starvation-inducible DNA-binding protein